MKPLVILFSVMCLLFNGCAAVRMDGRVYQATGDAMVKSADEEEANESKKKNEQQSNSRSENNKPQQEESISKKEPISNESQIVTIKKKYTTVNVRPDPSAKKPPVARLSGGDKVEKIGESPDLKHQQSRPNVRYG